MGPYVFVNTGQCGNQLGHTILDSLYDHLSYTSSSSTSSHNNHDIETDSALDLFFRRSNSSKSNKLYARAVCLDTEPKVVNECYHRSNPHRWCYNSNNILYRHGGAGNNWATGYAMYSGDFKETSLDSIRKEVECCDLTPSLVISHSVAGGTGSGLGTNITQTLHDEFPDLFRINVAVTPYHFGEIVVQHYNTILCLSKISTSSDGIIVFENEVAQDLCKKMRGLERPSLIEINQLIASNIVPLLLPKYDTAICNNVRTAYSTRSALSDDIRFLCSHPGYPFLDVKNTPQTSGQSIDFTYDSWSSIINTLSRMQTKGVACERNIGSTSNISNCSYKAVASVLTLLGPDSHNAAFNTNTIQSQQQQQHHHHHHQQQQQQQQNSFTASYASILSRSPLKISYTSYVANQYQRSACLLSNGQTIIPILQRAQTKAIQLYTAGAYLHQYQECVEQDEFLQGFMQIGQTLENYKCL